MKEIQLTHGVKALVDDWWYEELNQHKWYASWVESSKCYRAVRTVGTRGNQKMVFMHRVIANTTDDMLCDHIDHNMLNNQEHNLRNVTRSQNSMNARLRSDNKLKEKCICIHQGKYRVQIKKDGINLFDKKFDSLDEARKARDIEIYKIHGDYAFLP